MKIHGYKNYTEYRDIQVKANHDKIELSWVQPKVVKLISSYIRKVNPEPKFGLCHGTRRGIEQALFKKYLKCRVIGTEISDTAEKFPNTIEWDFHIVKSEWIRNCDFIYSNSLDHAYNPQGALEKWISCLNEKGILAIEWVIKCGETEKTANEVDPFSGTAAEVCALIEKAGGTVIDTHPMQVQTPLKESSLKSIVVIFAKRAA